MLVIEQMQRWRCPTYNPRTTVIAPYASTEVIAALPDAKKEQLLFFRCAPPGPDLFISTKNEAVAVLLQQGALPAALHARLPRLQDCSGSQQAIPPFGGLS